MPICPVCGCEAADAVENQRVMEIDGRKASQKETHIVHHEGVMDVYFHTVADDEIDPANLEGERRIVYRKIYEATIKEHSITTGQLAGWSLNTDMSSDTVREIARSLVEDGYVEEPTDSVLKAPEKHHNGGMT